MQALKAIREQLGFSIREMAAELALPAATYQGYESGRRKPPAYVLCLAKGSLERDRVFFSRYRPGGEFDQILQREHPNGIMSEVRNEY